MTTWASCRIWRLSVVEGFSVLCFSWYSKFGFSTSGGIISPDVLLLLYVELSLEFSTDVLLFYTLTVIFKLFSPNTISLDTCDGDYNVVTLLCTSTCGFLYSFSCCPQSRKSFYFILGYYLFLYLWFAFWRKFIRWLTFLLDGIIFCIQVRSLKLFC